MAGGTPIGQQGFLIAPRALILAAAILVTTAASSDPPYRRAEWPHWIDADGDCQNTRAEVLLRDAPAGAVTFRDERECTVAAGEWADPYTGGVLTQAGEVDVDHLVPLKNAHDSGGWEWTRERRREYANDLSYRYHLLAVSRAANRSKGDKIVEEARRPREEHKREAAAALRLEAFVEDERRTAEALVTVPLTVFLLDRPWNQGPALPGLTRVRGWGEILANLAITSRTVPI